MKPTNHIKNAVVVWLGVVLCLIANQNHAIAADDSSNSWVMGYYVAYQRDMYRPDEIDWTSLTHIIMARVKANADGSLNTNFDWDPVNGPALARDIATRAHAAGKKAILMLGGDDNGAEIHAAVRDHRSVFIANLVKAMSDYGYDGLDLDWESEVDWDLFIDFSKALRQAAPNAILTMPGGVINPNYMAIEPRIAQIVPQLDRFNLMSYYPATAVAGYGWLSWHNSPLKGFKSATPISIEDSLSRYVQIGIPAAKLGMGLSFFAICYTGGVTAPNQSTENNVAIRGGDNALPLASFFGANGLYSAQYRQWDSAALGSYMSLPTPDSRFGCRYFSFDDEQSILEKGKFSKENGYGGTIVWTLNQGYVRNLPAGSTKSPYFLMRALRQAFLDSTGPTNPVAVTIDPQTALVAAGHTVQFTARVTGSSDTQVAWNVTEPNGGSVNGTGLYTAPAQAGTYHLVATSHADASKSATATINVSASPGTNWDPKFSVLPSNNWFMQVHAENAQSVSLVLPDNSSTELDQAGWDANLFTGGINGVATGTLVRLHAIATDGRVAWSKPFAYLQGQPVLDSSPTTVMVTISPSTVSVAQGDTVQFTASVSGSSDTAVLFSVQEICGGCITSTGLYTAPNTDGTYHVVAKSQADQTKTTVATVTVTSAPPIGWDPHFSLGSSNSWYIQVHAEGAQSVTLVEVISHATYDLSQADWDANLFVGGINGVATGTSVQLHATAADGGSAWTKPFAYLQEAPVLNGP